jgi:acetyltransferase-like isoleucine patch superfamily enzyme
MRSVGKGTYGHQGMTIRRWYPEDGYLDIGKFSSIGEGITVLLGGNHRLDWVTTYPFPHGVGAILLYDKVDRTLQHHATRGDVIIGNDVWIGQGVTILSGVTIGDGSVIGAGAMVTKDVPPYSIVAGNPGSVKKYRFTPLQIEALLRIKWWDWEDDRINDNVNLLCSTSIQEFIDKNDVKIL